MTILHDFSYDFFQQLFKTEKTFSYWYKKKDPLAYKKFVYLVLTKKIRNKFDINFNTVKM